ncbi:MAG: NAD(P)/FAD-dependent oxidoreductase [Roseiflexaceae bacterium]
MADVLIAGGGIAGSALAVLLGRAGLAVELFERGVFPKEKPCGEGLMPAGVGVLERHGLADVVGGAPFHGVRYYAGALVAEGRFPAVAGLPATGRGQRRCRLDYALFAAAAATPGVTAAMAARVEAPICAGGRVVGLVVEGEPRRAPLVVAADGLRSPLRRQLGLDGPPPRRRRAGLRTHYRLAPGQAQPPWVEVFLGRGYEIYVTPLPEGEILVAGLAEQSAITSGAAAAMRCWIAGQPLLRARLEGAEQLTTIMGMAPLASRARAGVAPGAVLLGDAAGFLDPITGGGMAQALLSAELLAGYVARELGRDDAWLWEFERARRALLRDYRILTHMVLGLAAHPWLARGMLGLLRAAPTLFSHLLGVSGGMQRLIGPPLGRSD